MSTTRDLGLKGLQKEQDDAEEEGDRAQEDDEEEDDEEDQGLSECRCEFGANTLMTSVW